jgi:hypothetical protein
MKVDIRWRMLANVVLAENVQHMENLLVTIVLRLLKFLCAGLSWPKSASVVLGWRTSTETVTLTMVNLAQFFYGPSSNVDLR